MCGPNVRLIVLPKLNKSRMFRDCIVASLAHLPACIVFILKKKKSLLSINLRENVMMEACYGPCCTCVTDESHAPLSDQN